MVDDNSVFSKIKVAESRLKRNIIIKKPYAYSILEPG